MAANGECNPCMQLYASMVIWFGDFDIADGTCQAEEVKYEGRHAAGGKFLLSACALARQCLPQVACRA